MRVFTSHWRNPELRDLDATIIGISRGTPRWDAGFRYRRFWGLAPDDATWAHEDLEAFETSYRAQLERLGAGGILADLERIAGDGAAVLLCWEKPGEFCHRRVLAEWLHERTGIVVPELRAGMLPQREGVPEPRLF